MAKLVETAATILTVDSSMAAEAASRWCSAFSRRRMRRYSRVL